MDVISNNLANVNTTRTASGGPYRREHVVFEAINQGGFTSALRNALGDSTPADAMGGGVQVAAIEPDNGPLKKVYDPGNPDADKNGYVQMPNVEPVMEMVDLISATRAYEAGVSAINSAKQMQTKALDIGKA
jgi:flagellar basal-body rod protein FlgC